ncbi:hypothetical protein [Caulobacter sp. NIBR2454]|uniref:hypothetical protein n=1 Tax=Caulobacter sp. NIBR2454 TaxID=3015996 RepID=UPI0022B699F3|nr:hypothetical protein [Caulobacter sp. NIBR2454]
MSVGPVSGNGIALTIPTGKTVFWTVNVQASYSQFIKLCDSHGAVIFQATGASAGGHSPTQIGQGSFTAADASGNYTLYIGFNGGSSWSSVLWDDLVVNIGAQIYLSNYNFISEDGADQDFNDSHVSLTWFNSIG